MILNKYYFPITLFWNFALYAAAPINFVDYNNIGVWYNSASPITAQLVEGQMSVNVDTVSGANKLRVNVRIGDKTIDYISGLFPPRSSLSLALINVLANGNIQGFNNSELETLMKCISNDHGQDYISEQRAATLLFKAIDQYLDYCTRLLQIDDRKGSIRWLYTLAKIMSKDNNFGSKLVEALTHINQSAKKQKGTNLIPILTHIKNDSNLNNKSRLALQIILRELKDKIRDVVAHSEMIALFDIFAIRNNRSPIRLVTYLDMCYQCEKACVSVLQSISKPLDIIISSKKIPYKILVGSYKCYSNDGMNPANTRKRLQGKCTDLIKVALNLSSDIAPIADVEQLDALSSSSTSATLASVHSTSLDEKE